ncbi:helix-turn-helix domain-containing protein [Pelagovum pacificum]|uniref:Helix-turn-helix domain-containing protein n=1 Tax=Pelagovum pacificum TaxID=2588711 RepID=A0A5C5GKF5_9RHOB|nr:helix-turn-helix domain-containing protein [Pelagovum pacificum]
MPDWVPDPVRHYLAHTEAGTPIRALARQQDVHASTVLRQVRKLENRRDDPLVDSALKRLSAVVGLPVDKLDPDLPDLDTVETEAARVLRRLAEQGAVLAVAREMDRAVVVRDLADGDTDRLAVVDAPIAQVLALNEWIESGAPAARIARYRITASGRTALREMIAARENRARDRSEVVSSGPFRSARRQHRDATPISLPESPLVGLSRRRDRDGGPFLDRDLVRAGERLREDYELSRMAASNDTTADTPATAARARVEAAFEDLGPGLSDVALRCCCYLEGMEEAERRMGWSARSGKIVLRIALQRLRRHYDAQGSLAPKIG